MPFCDNVFKSQLLKRYQKVCMWERVKADSCKDTLIDALISAGVKDNVMHSVTVMITLYLITPHDPIMFYNNI